MQWESIAGKLIQAGAPILGGVLLGPVGSSMGGMIGNIVATALGVPATPEAVSAAIDSDPTAAERIKAAESAHSNDLAAFQATLLDAQNARAMQVATITSGSKISYTVPILTFVWVGAFFVVLVGLFFVWMRTTDPVAAQGVLGMIQLMIGALIGASSQTTNFWFGTTKSSHDNGVTMRGLAAAPPVVALPAR